MKDPRILLWSYLINLINTSQGIHFRIIHMHTCSFKHTKYFILFCLDKLHKISFPPYHCNKDCFLDDTMYYGRGELFFRSSLILANLRYQKIYETLLQIRNISQEYSTFSLFNSLHFCCCSVLVYNKIWINSIQWTQLSPKREKKTFDTETYKYKIGLFNVEFLPNQMLQAMKESRLSGTKTYFSNNFR